jgi:hypothetical protein
MDEAVGPKVPKEVEKNRQTAASAGNPSTTRAAGSRAIGVEQAKGREPMRKRMALLSAIGAIGLAAGCHHTGGECDCAPVPGDSIGANPHVTYHVGAPAVPATPVPAVKSTASIPSNGFEPIAPPKTLPQQ